MIMTTETRPKVSLDGEDGNALAILARCSKAARKADWTPEEISRFREKATSSDYEHLLTVVWALFDVD